MRIAGQAKLAATREDIWPLIFEPASLLELLPGCSEVRQTAPDEYTARLTLRVPALAGEYAAHVKVEESNPERYCRFSGGADGPAGSVKGTAFFALASEGDETLIEYQGDATISGPLAGMNSRFAEGVAKSLINQGITRLPQLAAARAAEKVALEAETSRESAPAHADSGFRRFLAFWRAWLDRLFGRRRSVGDNRDPA